HPQQKGLCRALKFKQTLRQTRNGVSSSSSPLNPSKFQFYPSPLSSDSDSSADVVVHVEAKAVDSEAEEVDTKSSSAIVSTNPRPENYLTGPRVVSWVRPTNEPHESIPQNRNPTELEPQSTGPLGVDLIMEELHRKPTEVSGEVEAEINSTGQVEDHIETIPPVVVMTEEEEGSVYSENENDPGGSPPVMVSMTPSESSSKSL
ncbi:lon protease homolog 1, mitochondrial-like isoform X2, partial [Fagus crenata]